jgi:hypothetical protein
MSHYDEKVVRELGLDFEYVKKKTPDYNSPGNEKIKAQLERIPSPTYVLVEGTDVLGVAIGGCDKGRFRTKIEDLLKNKPTTRGNNLHNPNAGGNPDRHCTDFDETGQCKPFRWDCQPDDAVVCRPKKGKDTYQYKVSTHGCNNCKDDGGGSDLEYEWEDKDGNDIDRDPETKEIQFDVTPDTPLGKYHFKCTAHCRDWPNSTPDTLIKEFDLIVQDCDEPEPLPDPIKPEEYDCDCPPEVIQLWFDDERGIYGANYDKDRISSIQYIDAWDPEKRALKLWLRPGGCNLDDVCECVNLCSQTTAAGYPITDMQSTCETNEKENSVTLTFTGSWIEPNTGQGSSEEPEEPDTRGDDCCDEASKYEDDDYGDCEKGGGNFVTVALNAVDGHQETQWWKNGTPVSKKDEFRIGEMRSCSMQGGTNGGCEGIFDLCYEKDDKPDCECEDDDDCDDDEECDGCDCKKKDKPDGPDCECEDDDDCDDDEVCDGCDCKKKDDPDPAPPEIEKDPCKDVECGDCEECVDGECVSLCAGDKICVDGECADPFVEASGNFYPNCINIQCCPDCDDEVPPFEPGDNDDCDNKPDPNPVPGTGGPAASVYLYDRLNHTYVFCCPILADVTWLLPFDAIPPVFQRYITAAATVRAAAQLVNNPQLFQLLKDRENTLRMECMNYELEQGDLTFLGQPDHTAYVGYQPIQTLNR